VVFQPAEEDAAGGKAMIDDGLVDRFGIDEFYALHNLPGLPLGHIATRPGSIMGTSDEFLITLSGRGGHPASPHKALDTTMVAAQMLLTLNTIISRNVDPHAAAALGVTMFSTDSNATNIIAQTVRMEGTVRSLDEATRESIKARVEDVVDGVARTFGVDAKLSWPDGYPIAVTAAEQTQAALQAARNVAENVNDTARPLLQSEDFAYMLKARPGALIFLGNGNSAMLHDPKYDFDDRAIETGIRWFCTLAETRLAPTPAIPCPGS
jgi:hippurate hydrolase